MSDYIPQAFPCVHDRHLQEGMTLRDWFAGQALAGIDTYNEVSNPLSAAKYVYEIADAMIAARKGTGHEAE